MKFLPVRRAAALVAAATAVTFGLGAGAADATATPQPVVTLQPIAPLALPAAGAVSPQLDWSTSRNVPGFQSVTLTVDARGLARVAKVAFAAQCRAHGLVASCDDSFDLASGGMGESAPFTVTPLKGVKLGSVGSFTISGVGAGLIIHGGTGRVVVGGPAYNLDALARHRNVAVGTTVAQPITFSNLGTLPAAGSAVGLMLSPGLRFTQHFGNCDYRTLVRKGQRYEDAALCHFPDWMRIGEKVTFAQPVRTQVTPQALWTYMDVIAAPAGDQASLQWVTAPGPGVSWHRGSGQVLRLKQLVAGRPSSSPAGNTQLQLGNQGNGIEWIAAHNGADYGVTGSSAKAAKGTDVTMSFTMANHGPAVLYDRSGGEAAPFVKITAPTGTTVVGGPECGYTVSSTVGYCSAGMAGILVWPGDSFHFTITFHVNTVVAHAHGLVQLVAGGGPVPSTTLSFDPNPRNNTAALLLN
ncbi:hypothetical protein ABIA32_004873 [Streptacidiphilus sp. MAP12-20]|uniref:hypothetical protein n=1 Tax=Streptacidiphilus sp. MAP12-20 TaxID=3156299 RepID=UPI0035162A84